MPAASEVGIDLGLTTFAVLSNGKRIDSPRFFRRAERQLAKAQNHFSRKRKGSANRARARIKVARAHAKVADARRDWTHAHHGDSSRKPSDLYRGLVREGTGLPLHLAEEDVKSISWNS
ncbi:transposase [Nocardia sp. NPDC056000]|uniref:transposase n=1 Tax=Nocardia sp. NPDC056000 TaxID=3345674 RepID=UPI0035E3B3FC